MGPQGGQANVEFWYRLLYELIQKLLHPDANISALLVHAWNMVVIVGILASVFGLFVVVYTTIRLHELRTREEEIYGHVHIAAENQEENPRWTEIEKLIGSENPNDWRQAIIEADVMLDDVLRRAGFPGNGVGERLQSADPSNFTTLQYAWDAHKVRNQIAHEGTAFQISQTIAQRAIAQFEAVFREFAVI